MKVEIALDMNQLQTLASRVAPAPAQNTRNAGGAGAKGKGGRGGKSGGGGGGGQKREKQVKKSAEELDAEMNVSCSSGRWMWYRPQS